jgi:hypothetical protein
MAKQLPCVTKVFLPFLNSHPPLPTELNLRSEAWNLKPKLAFPAPHVTFPTAKAALNFSDFLSPAIAVNLLQAIFYENVPAKSFSTLVPWSDDDRANRKSSDQWQLTNDYFPQ